jgi:hypothetical protein
VTVQDIEALADRLAIERLVVKYAKGRDTTDADIYREIFAEDATISSGSGMVLSGDREAILGKVANDVKRFNPGFGEGKTSYAIMRHLVTNIDIELDGNHASADYYVTTLAQNEAAKRLELVALARNEDRYEKREGRWWIVSSTLFFGWENDEMGRMLKVGPYTPDEYKAKPKAT